MPEELGTSTSQPEELPQENKLPLILCSDYIMDTLMNGLWNGSEQLGSNFFMTLEILEVGKLVARWEVLQNNHTVLSDPMMERQRKLSVGKCQ